MTEATTLTHALRPEDKINRVELRRTLRRSLRADKISVPFFNSRLELTLFAVAAMAVLATPLVRASIKAKEDLVEIAARFRTPSQVDDSILTGSITPALKPVVLAPKAIVVEPPRLRGGI